MIVRKQKAFITLLEVLLVIGILAAVGSITAFNVTKLFREQKALDEMNQVVHLLKTASDLMMMVDFDSEIRFSKKEDKLQVEMVPKSSISPLILPLIPTKPLVLEIVNRFEFDDGIKEVKLTDQFSLLFQSKGFIMNRGVLSLHAPDVTGSVILYGYPTALTLTKGTSEYPDQKAFQDAFQAITDQTRQETMEAVSS